MQQQVDCLLSVLVLLWTHVPDDIINLIELLRTHTVVATLIVQLLSSIVYIT